MGFFFWLAIVASVVSVLVAGIINRERKRAWQACDNWQESCQEATDRASKLFDLWKIAEHRAETLQRRIDSILDMLDPEPDE